ncbi:hypothetical protein HPT25_16900 [Bacillus sp. BRMEA1]|uniref:hypothetical protein n=1 Tax=Neobacillus endophyticus TaxID=2738405 RepID=UPI001565F55B|nr:hypothetical protein [Neobacillus endophyticus]NRD79039.1 hypothetical protein [Neobacillus endophyticus]
MEKETEKQILNELKNISQSLESINIKLENNEEKPFYTVWLIVKSLLIGIFVVGPAIVIVIGIFMIIISWLSNYFGH